MPRKPLNTRNRTREAHRLYGKAVIIIEVFNFQSSPCFLKYRRKYKVNYSFVALRIAGDLSFHFRVKLYVQISFLNSVSLSDGIKNCPRKAKIKTGFEGYLEIAKSYQDSDKDSGSTHKVTPNFMETCVLNPAFGQNLVFVVREQLLRTKPTPDSDLPWSKIPPQLGILFFDRMSATSSRVYGPFTGS